MAEGVYTEREWRLRGGGVQSPIAICWGAQYIQPVKRRNLHRNRRLHCAMLVCAAVFALLLPLCWPHRAVPVSYPMAVAPVAAEGIHVRSVQGVSFAMPTGITFVQHTYTKEELYRGKLLLIDDQHPLPMQAPHPGTLNIATYGKGMVPVSDLTLKTGRETIRALTALFADLRGNGIGGFSVWQGTQTPAEQLEDWLTFARQSAGQFSLDTAIAQTQEEMEPPGSGELLQEYTVELRMSTEGKAVPDERPLEETVQGRQLLRFAWRNGFVRTQTTGSKRDQFRFRYVGIAHATAMTYLDVDLPTYLAILHEKRTLTVQGEGGQLYLIQCVPAAGNHVVLSVPKGAEYEVSLDNTGYAVVASVLKEGWQKRLLPAVSANSQ